MTRRPMFLSAAVVALAVTSTACDDDVIATDPSAAWTIMVYMAADNNIAADGEISLNDIRAGNASARVNVVVQADFPNQNTFRELISGGETSTTDIGERNMSLPSELREFVEWSDQNVPAERSILFLWDHGGQYQGGLTDDSHASQMPISGLTTALSGKSMDVLAFDMCLMAGYETLVKVAGVSSFTVFSEHTVPGDGSSFPYTAILNAISSNPSTDARAVAELIPDLYVELHADRAESVTLSSYDLEGLAPFLEAVDSLGSLLERRVKDTATETEYVTAIRTAATGTQLYSEGDHGFPEVKDLVDFLDSLEVRLDEGDDSTRARVATLRERALDPAFRLKNEFNTAPPGERNVDRSNGLTIVLPTAQGQADLDIYRNEFSSSHWGDLLNEYDSRLQAQGAQPPPGVADPDEHRKCLDRVIP